MNEEQGLLLSSRRKPLTPGHQEDHVCGRAGGTPQKGETWEAGESVGRQTSQRDEQRDKPLLPGLLTWDTGTVSMTTG